jgi:hypothetical protein
VKRELAISLLRSAGYHNDGGEFVRLYVENRVSYTKAKEAFSQGRAARARGVKCGCRDCQQAVSS